MHRKVSSPGSARQAFKIAPNTESDRLTRTVLGLDHEGQEKEISVVEERPLTIFLNSTEIVTAMTIGDHPKFLALGFLFNQGMIETIQQVIAVDFDEDLETVVVRTEGTTSYEDKLKKKTRTSGCAMGTVFGDLAEIVDDVVLPDAEVRTSWLYELVKTINTTPSLYLKAGAIHGTVLCKKDQPLVYMEDVGRHNAVDKIAGWMKIGDVNPQDKILYTTGRLTSEMILKTVMMGIPALVSRSGFTAWGVDLARKSDLTLIGRMRGKRFVCLSGERRLIQDADAQRIKEEDPKHVRKASRRD